MTVIHPPPTRLPLLLHLVSMALVGLCNWLIFVSLDGSECFERERGRERPNGSECNGSIVLLDVLVESGCCILLQA